MLGLTEEIKTFGDALESQGEISLENPEHEGDVSFRLLQVAGGYLKGSGKPCEGCKHILRNTQGEVALIFVHSGRVVSNEKNRGIVAISNYVVCGESCKVPITPEDYIPDEQLGLPLVNLNEISYCDKRK